MRRKAKILFILILTFIFTLLSFFSCSKRNEISSANSSEDDFFLYFENKDYTPELIINTMISKIYTATGNQFELQYQVSGKKAVSYVNNKTKQKKIIIEYGKIEIIDKGIKIQTIRGMQIELDDMQAPQNIRISGEGELTDHRWDITIYADIMDIDLNSKNLVCRKNVVFFGESNGLNGKSDRLTINNQDQKVVIVLDDNASLSIIDQDTMLKTQGGRITYSQEEQFDQIVVESGDMEYFGYLTLFGVNSEANSSMVPGTPQKDKEIVAEQNRKDKNAALSDGGQSNQLTGFYAKGKKIISRIFRDELSGYKENEKSEKIQSEEKQTDILAPGKLGDIKNLKISIYDGYSIGRNIQFYYESKGSFQYYDINQDNSFKFDFESCQTYLKRSASDNSTQLSPDINNNLNQNAKNDNENNKNVQTGEVGTLGFAGFTPVPRKITKISKNNQTNKPEFLSEDNEEYFFQGVSGNIIFDGKSYYSLSIKKGWIKRISRTEYVYSNGDSLKYILKENTEEGKESNYIYEFEKAENTLIQKNNDASASNESQGKTDTSQIPEKTGTSGNNPDNKNTPVSESGNDLWFYADKGNIVSGNYVHLTGNARIKDYLRAYAIGGGDLFYYFQPKKAEGKDDFIIFEFRDSIPKKFSIDSYKNKEFTLKGDQVKRIIQAVSGIVYTETAITDLDGDIFIRDYENYLDLKCLKLHYSGKEEDTYLLESQIEIKKWEDENSYHNEEKLEIILQGDKAKVYNKDQYALITGKPKLLNVKEKFYVNAEVIESFFKTKHYLFKNNVLFLFEEKNQGKNKTILSKADYADYDNGVEYLILQGNCSLVMDKNTTKADKIEIDIKKRLITVNSLKESELISY